MTNVKIYKFAAKYVEQELNKAQKRYAKAKENGRDVETAEAVYELRMQQLVEINEKIENEEE